MSERPLIKLLSERDTLNEKLESLKADMENCKDTKLQEEFVFWKNAKESLESQIQRCNEELSSIQQKLEEEQTKISELETDISCIEEKLSQTQKEIEDLRTVTIIVCKDGNIKKDDNTELVIPNNWKNELMGLISIEELASTGLGVAQVHVLAKAISICRATNFLCEVKFEDETLDEIFKKVV